MIEFINDPIVVVKDDNTFILKDDFIVKCYDETLIIPQGFTTDFASVPRIPVVFTLFAGRAKKSAILHDYLYEQKLFDRKTCDELFLCAMEAEGISWWIRSLMYRGVRLGGASYYEN